ncbi:hypothetical protein ACTWPT_19675 [Nonomuraea sp. 3N208]|uniref:hypothetical protein n=1 Tax=Nonomuraea sp. 3N208 TaxID=3457421 RepID=UPI003FCD2DDF
MRSPSRLRRTVAGLAVGSAVVAAAFTTDTASAGTRTADPFGGFDPGSGFTSPGGGSGGFDISDFFGDLGDFANPNPLPPSGGFPGDTGTPVPPQNGGQPQTGPNGTSTPPRGTPGQTPSTNGSLSDWLEQELKRAGGIVTTAAAERLAGLIRGQSPQSPPQQRPGQPQTQSQSQPQQPQGRPPTQQSQGQQPPAQLPQSGAQTLAQPDQPGTLSQRGSQGRQDSYDRGDRDGRDWNDRRDRNNCKDRRSRNNRRDRDDCKNRNDRRDWNGHNDRWDENDWNRRRDLWFWATPQQQNCRTPAYVRLIRAPKRDGRLTAANAFIGGEKAGETLTIPDNEFLAAFGDKLRGRSKASYIFLSSEGSKVFSPQPVVASNSVLNDTNRYSPIFLTKGVTYTLIVQYYNTCGELITDVLGQVKRG